MIQISIPFTFKEERMYIINTLLRDYLGLKININLSDKIEDYVLKLENNKKLIIKDSFFSKIKKSNDYLNMKYLPKKVLWLDNPFIVEKDIPVLYGTKQFHIEQNKIICGIDLFASSYFMLTRWEEYVNKVRDNHNRFPATESVAYKNDFLDRPVVNEYVEMLWNMLVFLGIKQTRKKRVFKFINTHDVDHIYKWSTLNKLTNIMLSDLVKRKNIKLAINRFREYANIKIGREKDPFDTFEWLMDLSSKANLKSHFYFMSGGETNYDNHYRIDEKKSLNIINKIKDQGHIIGFHPSYNTYNNPELWKKEKEKLEDTLKFEVFEGRQHYLRFEAPFTWQIWAENGMKIDSTLSYPEIEGFRCGTCYEYFVFNFLTKKVLPLRESPLILMEASLLTYQDLSKKYIIDKSKKIIDKVKKYNGNFVLLWHNSSFVNSNTLNYQEIYSEILSFNKQGDK